MYELSYKIFFHDLRAIQTSILITNFSTLKSYNKVVYGKKTMIP